MSNRDSSISIKFDVGVNDPVHRRSLEMKMSFLPEQIPACEKPSCDAKEPNHQKKKERNKNRNEQSYVR